MTAQEIISVIPLMEGKFSPEEAVEIIETMVQDRIRSHDIQMLRMWESNHLFDSADWDKKIKEIKVKKNIAREAISEARKEGYQIEIVSTIQVRICKPGIKQLKLDVTKNLQIQQN